MKKLMIAACAVAFAAAAQAAMVNWTTGYDVPMGVDTSALNGNTTIAAGSYDINMSGDVFAYVLTVYDGATTVGSASGNLEYGWMGNVEVYDLSVGTADAWTAGKEYTYEIVISGAQSNFVGYEDANWKYSSAEITSTLTGSFTGATGTPDLETGVPATWTVSGAIAKEEPVPEPTSAMLMLLGMAGLALRRKQK